MYLNKLEDYKWTLENLVKLLKRLSCISVIFCNYQIFVIELKV